MHNCLGGVEGRGLLGLEKHIELKSVGGGGGLSSCYKPLS